MGEDVGPGQNDDEDDQVVDDDDDQPDGSDQHVLCPAGLKNGLLDPLHVDVEAALLKRTRERVRGQRLKPREQGEVAVVELALRKDPRDKTTSNKGKKRVFLNYKRQTQKENTWLKMFVNSIELEFLLAVAFCWQ